MKLHFFLFFFYTVKLIIIKINNYKLINKNHHQSNNIYYFHRDVTNVYEISYIMFLFIHTKILSLKNKLNKYIIYNV